MEANADANTSCSHNAGEVSEVAIPVDRRAGEAVLKSQNTIDGQKRFVKDPVAALAALETNAV